MADDRVSPFDDDDNATQILQGLISPAPAQTLVAPPPDVPPRSGPAESTPLTGNLTAPPSQAVPKVDRSPLPQPASTTQTGAGAQPAYDIVRATQLEQARDADSIPLNPSDAQYQPGLGTKIRRGLAGYFSGGIGGALNANYSAPTGNYGLDEAARKARLAQDNASLAALNNTYAARVRNYQQALNQRNNQLPQTQEQGVGAPVATGDQQTSPSGRPTAPTVTASGSGSEYVKVLSNGQIGYLPKANLAKAQQRDKKLKVLE